MEHQYFDLEQWIFQLITYPLCGFNLVLNIFYIHCLMSSRQKPRPPLRMLLAFLIWCSTTFDLHLVFWHLLLTDLKVGTGGHQNFFWMISLFLIHSSMMCSMWMSIYFYINVVPSQRALLIWIKRNLRLLVYVFFLLDEILIAIYASMANSTMILDNDADNCTSVDLHNVGFAAASSVCVTFGKIHLLSCMAIMGVCNFSLAHYLHGHIKSITQEGFTSPGIRSQLQIVIYELLQGVFFLINGLLYFIDSLSFHYSEQFFLGPLLSLTFILLYMTGTMASLAICQAIFRQGAVDVWKVVTAPCSANV